jgi:small subunit ribosomal protein S1
MVVANRPHSAELSNQDHVGHANHDNPLPPIDERDEGWWESVLADEERFSSAHRPRLPVAASPAAEKPAPHAEPMAEPPQSDWVLAESIYKQDQIISLSVSGYNRGGLLVENEKLHGFVPYSHLVDMTCQTDLERENFLAEYVGKELRLKVIECVPEEGRVVFSERAARADAGRRTELFSSLRQGEIVTGEVTNITEFGAFIDLGGVEGLIHISELSWGRVIHPSHILKLGQMVKVQVIDILPERCRIALSLKRLQSNPWEFVGTRYSANDIVPATITSVVSYGVFARLEEGLEGLIHVSEMNLNGTAVRDVYSEGQKINVRILHMDPPHQRLGLSLKLDGTKPNA